MKTPRAIAWMAMAAASWAVAAEQAPQLEAGASHESLSNGFDDWRSVYANAAWKRDSGFSLYGGLMTTDRFSLRDHEATAGTYLPLNSASNLLIDASVSATHRVLPRASALLQLEHRFVAGLGVQAGLRRTVYDDAWSNQELAAVERYWGNQHASYTFYIGQLEGGGSPSAHRGQWHYYYTDTSSVGLSYSRGVEIERDAGGRTLTSDVRSLSLDGRHWFAPTVAVTYELSRVEQGTSYVRRGLRLGLRLQY